ncbi:MAG: hypothetical protein MJY54_01475 [archaeon]|nr:hypothetical protein [archaeon]
MNNPLRMMHVYRARDMTTNETLEEHLLFYRSLIYDDSSIERIDKYLKILNETSDCEKMQNPIDESIRMVFQLVIEKNFDPWAIDISQFANAYYTKISNNDFDIIITGKFILMAWKILRMQANAAKILYIHHDKDKIKASKEVFVPESYIYIPNNPLRMACSRTIKRPVTIVELLEAFNEAKNEFKIYTKYTSNRVESKKSEISNKIHRELSKNDVEEIWKRIQKIDLEVFSINKLFTDDIDNNITIFISVLQLARDGRLSVWQDGIPYGDIILKVKTGQISEDNNTEKYNFKEEC